MNFKITNQTEFDSRKLLDKDIKKAWTDALRSGKYEQGINKLCFQNKYCCLGVLLEINNFLIEKAEHKGTIDGNYDNISEFTEHFNMGKLGDFEGFLINDHTSLATLNDIENFTFGQIAEVIELYF